MNFGTISTAMVTPFTSQGTIDFNQTTNLVNYLLDNGTDSLVVGGTTGESPTLSTDEKISLFEHVVQVVNGRVPVIAGTGSNSTQASIELTKKAEAAGADAIMLVAPYYNKPNQEGLFQHFNAIALSTDLPVMIYNIPGRSVVNIEVKTLLRLAAIDNVVAIKEASGNLDQMTDILANAPEGFAVYSGDDGLTLPLLAIGGRGVVSVTSHVAGKEMKKMVQHFQNGRLQDAAKLHQKLLPLTRALFAQPNPAPVKVALRELGIDCGPLRLPLVSLEVAEEAALLATLDQFSQETKSNV
ncbi:4-hydroxy-tetrahydrodipicolinate synthase [Jeotgalibacillus soli]|uniref:4-hydroxy-tetrahydrodipicolinate synthase n=1 Tax=Jeotgalibacillus soli TaxID=889306 RepID=A0A0C2R3V1_9BACL|nr:4-hydroxy-tetrahydrodipicolinate synthase [Jeotgalibacillus soli]KIL44940.1 dihydrodipicolinate synthase [Jeotgalibacillus soli]